MTDNLPQKPELGEWLADKLGLPFQIPRIPFVQTAKNLDKAVATLVAAGGENLAAQVRASTTRIEARSDAEMALIEYGTSQIENADPELATRAREHAIGDILRAQKNREQVLRHTSEALEEDVPKSESPTEIDDDWLNAFSKYAEQKSKVDVQKVWGRILAAEIRNPGATSLRTLQFLSTVSSAEAVKIARAFSYVVNASIIPTAVKDDNRISYSDLLELQELGVLNGLYGIGGPTLTLQATPIPSVGMTIPVNYINQAAIFHGPLEGEFKIAFPALILTEIGRQLYAISETKTPDYEFFRGFCLKIKPANATTVQLLGPETGRGTIIFQAAS